MCVGLFRYFLRANCIFADVGRIVTYGKNLNKGIRYSLLFLFAEKRMFSLKKKKPKVFLF